MNSLTDRWDYLSQVKRGVLLVRAEAPLHLRFRVWSFLPPDVKIRLIAAWRRL